MNIDVSVIIVNYNTKDWLRRYLKSIIRETKGVSYEIIVVDNASPDDSAGMVLREFKKEHNVLCLASHENLYTTKGFNQGLGLAQGRHIFISDADLELKNNVLGRMVRILDKNKDIGVVGCRFENPDGTIQEGYSRDFNFPFALLNFTFLGKLFPRTLENMRNDFTYNGWGRCTSCYIDVCDTAFMARREVFGEGYDPGLTMYGHNQLLCYKAKKVGWKVYFIGDTYIVHGNHVSVNKENWLKISKIYRKDLGYLLKQTIGYPQAIIVMNLLYVTAIGLYISYMLGLYEPKKSIAYGLS